MIQIGETAVYEELQKLSKEKLVAMYSATLMTVYNENQKEIIQRIRRLDKILLTGSLE